MNIYGTLGPACDDESTLAAMFKAGMTGIRLNLSHTTLSKAQAQTEIIRKAAATCGITPEFLIDMQGPELRIGKLDASINMNVGEIYYDIPVPECIKEKINDADTVLFDDGKIEAQVTVTNGKHGFKITRGDILQSGKSIAVPGLIIETPAVTDTDRDNLKNAKACGVTGVMQPFVRSKKDLKELRNAMLKAGCADLKILAKVENQNGVEHLEDFFDIADEIVIARGDLGNAVPLWELPRIQKEIAKKCRNAGKPFMVVTQMLDSMTHCAVPTRAEVSDIFNAVLDGAASIMVTGETAVGRYPAEVIKYLKNTAAEAERYIGK